ncbi:uncharacterized protein LOC131306931 [Rhododendron vialii]|uniref:uncharacterized protein LOC131306931 n=1 Tax=Rhododendron vialii TaxID=182163 RepID=UPI00265E28E0|nr:uncharacterized protein LOC131306931 [Rhododendron vialii]
MKKVSEDGEGSAIQVPISRDHGLKEPLQVRAKGCGKRLKGGKEKAAKKARRCHGCGLTGQSHDKRNCPKLLSTSSQNARLNDKDEDDDDGIDYADADDSALMLYSETSKQSGAHRENSNMNFSPQPPSQ